MRRTGDHCPSPRTDYRSELPARTEVQSRLCVAARARILGSPQWIGKTDSFWYASRAPTGTRYWKVDPTKKEKLPLFDHVVLAAALSEAAKKPLDGDTLRIDRAVVSADGKKLTFVFSGNQYEYDLVAAKLKPKGKAPTNPTAPLSADAIERMRQQLGDERVNEMLRRLREDDTEQKKDDTKKEDTKKDDTKKDDTKQDEKGDKGKSSTRKGGGPTTSYKNYSPNKKHYVYGYKYNLYLCEEGQPEDKATQLSKDSVEDYAFSGGPGGFGGGKGKGKGTEAPPTTPGDRKSRVNVTWSKDSKAFYVSRTDSRGINELYPGRFHRHAAAEARAVQVSDARGRASFANPSSTTAMSRRRP